MFQCKQQITSATEGKQTPTDVLMIAVGHKLKPQNKPRRDGDLKRKNYKPFYSKIFP